MRFVRLVIILQNVACTECHYPESQYFECFFLSNNVLSVAHTGGRYVRWNSC